MGLLNTFGPPVGLAVVMSYTGTGIQRRSTVARTWIWILGYVPPPLYIAFFALAAEPSWRYKYGHHYASLLEVGAAPALINLIVLGGMALYMYRPCQADDQQRMRRGDILVQGLFLTYILYFAMMGALVYKLKFFVIQPFIYAVCHAVVLYQLAGRGVEPWSRRDGKVFGITLGGSGAGFALKDYFAWDLFYSLPETPPRMCVIITAASHGHPGVVRSWQEPESRRVLNRQLLFFYRFEDLLMERYPALHAALRRAYNRYAPALANHIDRPWKADLVYLALKPVQAALGIFMILLRYSRSLRPASTGN